MAEVGLANSVELQDITTERVGLAQSLDINVSNQKLQKVSLVWHKLNLSLRVKDVSKSNLFKSVYKKKKILQNVSGCAKSGELIALMGPTGCGKSSFMNILAARVSGMKPPNTELTGSVFLNNQPRVDAVFRKISAYVLQVLYCVFSFLFCFFNMAKILFVTCRMIVYTPT